MWWYIIDRIVSYSAGTVSACDFLYAHITELEGGIALNEHNTVFARSGPLYAINGENWPVYNHV